MDARTDDTHAGRQREAEFLELMRKLPRSGDGWLLRTLVQLQPLPCCVVRGGDHILCTNRAFCEFVGYDAAGRSLAEFTPPPLLPFALARWAWCGDCPYEVLARAAGRHWYVRVEPVPLAWNGHQARALVCRPVAQVGRVRWVGVGVRVGVGTPTSRGKALSWPNETSW